MRAENIGEGRVQSDANRGPGIERKTAAIIIGGNGMARYICSRAAAAPWERGRPGRPGSVAAPLRGAHSWRRHFSRGGAEGAGLFRLSPALWIQKSEESATKGTEGTKE